MWWPKAGLAAGLACVALSGLSGCQVRPLYAAGPGAGALSATTALPAIAVDAPATREEQVYRNVLLFALQGGGGGSAPLYNLSYRLIFREQEILVERDTGTPNAYQLTGGVSFLLKETATGKSLFGANVTGLDSYTRSSQNFANIRARRDSEDRLARTLAELTQARLAAYFAVR